MATWRGLALWYRKGGTIMIVIIQDNEFVTEPIKIIDQLSEATTKEKLFFYENIGNQETITFSALSNRKEESQK
jgi:hypothetical protein